MWEINIVDIIKSLQYVLILVCVEVSVGVAEIASMAVVFLRLNPCLCGS